MRIPQEPRLPSDMPGLVRQLTDLHRQTATQVNMLAEGYVGAATNATTAAPTTGEHYVGDFVRNSAPAELGSAGNEYVVLGWVCTVSGTPGTWVEARAMVDDVGGGGSTAGRHAVFVPAGAMSPSASGGCAALATIASAANQPDIQTLDFDATTQEYAQFFFRMPKSWNEGTVTFAPVWSHAATTTNFGVVWDMQLVAVSNDDPIAVAFGTAQTSTDTGGTTNDIYIGPESSAITIAGTPAAEDMVFGRISRVTGNGSDTMAVDARLHGFTLYMTTDADTDA